jgi:hypothetical protein
MARLVNREELLRVLETVSPGVGKGAKEGSAQAHSFAFTNGTVATYNDDVTCRAPNELVPGLECAVRAEPLLKVLRALQDKEVQVEANGSHLVIAARRKRARVVMDAEVSMPLVDQLDPPKGWQPLHPDFGEGVGLVVSCTGTVKAGAMTTYAHVTPDFLESTDNYQAGRYEVPTPIGREVFVRGEALKHAGTLGMVECCLGTNWLHFRNTTGLLVSCRNYQLEGFVEVGAYLALDGAKAVLPLGLAEAAKLARDAFTGEDKDRDHVTVELRKGGLRLTGLGPSGDYQEVKGVHYDGPPVAFLMKPEVLAAVCQKWSECRIGDGRLVAHSGRFKYVTVLKKVG